MYRYTLEKGAKKFTCPQCGTAKKYRRVIDQETGEYLPFEVGICDRSTSCGYQYTWKQFFADSPDLRPGSDRFRHSAGKRRIPRHGSTQTNRAEGDSEGRSFKKRSDYLEMSHLIATGQNYDQNTLVQFFLGLFPNDPEDVWTAVQEYGIGTLDGFTVFPTISKAGELCKGKLMKFDTQTGGRLKIGYRIDSLENKLKKAGKISQNFETDKDVFFGEHLTAKYPDRPIAIVESEKTAVLCSICKGVFPDLVWLATDSKQWLNTDRLKRLGRDRIVFLWPDTDGFQQWQRVASDARMIGLTVHVSTRLEMLATDKAKAAQVDLADYLISEQREINRINAMIYAIKGDPDLLNEYDRICKERIALMRSNGECDVTDTVAEEYVRSTEFIRRTV